ncbi:MAG: holo-ACP synthase [Chloroflexi bacterium]|nr:holo-ACP synthase [Chloroflexota bacterium]
MIYGTGIDLQPVRQIEEAIRRRGEAYLQHLFTPQERFYCEGKKTEAQSYAARFAAKEAFFKASRAGWRSSVKWTDLEVFHDAEGQPQLALHDEAKQLAEDAGIKHVHLSLSHTDEFAVAQVILEK